MTNHAPIGRTPGSPAVLLNIEHVPTVRAVLAANPGIGLRKLAPLVQHACALPSINIATLSRFMARHKLRHTSSAHGDHIRYGKAGVRAAAANAPAPDAFRPPVRCAADCWDWLSADDVVRHALAAHYLACRRHEYFESSGEKPESDFERTTFLWDVWKGFQLRLIAHGADARICESFHQAMSKAHDDLAEFTPEGLAAAQNAFDKLSKDAA